MALLAWLWERGSAGSIPREHCNTIYKAIAKRFLASADLSKAKSKGGINLEYANKRQRTSYQSSKSNAAPTKKKELRTTITYDVLVNFYDTLAKLSTPIDDLVAQD